MPLIESYRVFALAEFNGQIEVRRFAVERE
jgi:hypothetical protein